jgi:streptogramin lyase
MKTSKIFVVLALAIAGFSGFGVSASHADLLVCSASAAQVLRFDDSTGAFLGVFTSGGGLNTPEGLVIGPDGNLYVSSGTDQVLRYDGTSGSFIDVFASGGGLLTPAGLVFGPDGNLYVDSFNSNQVLRYDGGTGAFLGVFASGGGLTVPWDLVFGPDGNLYVSGLGAVLRYNGTTGAFMDVFASFGGGGVLTGLVFGPDGNLYVSSYSTGQVLRYNGSTGAFVDVFASSCFEPAEVAFGPDGNLYCSSNILGQVLRYDGSTGAFLDVFASGLVSPRFFAFTSLSRQLTALSPAKVWIGRKGSDAVGLKVDLLVEVIVRIGSTETQVGRGELDNVSTGSSGFNNAILNSVTLGLLGGAVDVPAGAALETRVSVRRTCSDAGRGSGRVQLWYNGRPVDSGDGRDAGSRFDATIGGSTEDYYLRSGFALAKSAGSSRTSADVTVNSHAQCPARPFTPFGTWSGTLP